MVFCSNCGKDLPENAYFCPKCGVRTIKGVETGISTPWEDLRGTLSKMGEEMEKAFSIAGKEMEKAFKTARDRIMEATTREPVACPHCGEEINLFKTNGGQLTAKKEGLRLLGSLPLDPEVVRRGDAGDLAGLDDDRIPFVHEFNKIVEQVEGITNKEATVSVIKQDDIKERKDIEMEKIIIAIPTAGGKLCAHFGHCEQFALVETEDGKIKGTSMQTPPPHEPGVLPKWLHEQGVNIVLAGGLGARAKQLFEESGVKVFTGVPMEAAMSTP